MKELFILWIAASPTDYDILNAEEVMAFTTDFECSEAEVDLEHEYPESHVFCTDMTGAIALKNGVLFP